MFDDDGDARTEFGVKEAFQRGADTAGGARARHVVHSDAEPAFDDLREVRQRGVQCGDVGLGGTFLRSEHGAGAGGTGQRVGHVAGGGDGDVLESRVHRADVDGGQISEGRSPVLKVVAVPVQKTNAEGLQKSGTGVVGGAAAEPDDDALGSGTDGGEYEFAGAVGGGNQRVAFFGFKQCEAAGFGCLDHGGRAVGEQAEVAFDRSAERVVDRHGVHRSASGVDKRACGAFTAVGHGKATDLGIVVGILNPLSHRPGRLHGGQALFEGVRGA